MKTSTEIGSIAKVMGEERAIEAVAKAGFDAWDLSMFDMCTYNGDIELTVDSQHPLGQPGYVRYAQKLKKIGEDNGIICNQSHAPFPSFFNGMETYLKRAIECTAEAGGDICVIHPCNNKSAEENAEMYMRLLPFAKDYGVKIATENMWDWDNEANRAGFAACATAESFKAHLDAVDDDYFVACLDIGHAEMMGDSVSAEEMVLKLGDKLQALHIHDNDRWHDSHQIPFSMDIDFEKVVKALKTIDYKGYFTLEAGNYIKDFAKEDAHKAVKDLAVSARRLADMFENM